MSSTGFEGYQVLTTVYGDDGTKIDERIMAIATNQDCAGAIADNLRSNGYENVYVRRVTNER